MLFFDDTSFQYYLFICLINFVGALFSGALLFFHLRLIIQGKSTNERTTQFDMGTKENLKVVFGDNLFLAFLCPFLESKIEHDGVTWKKMELVKDK